MVTCHPRAWGNKNPSLCMNQCDCECFITVYYTNLNALCYWFSFFFFSFDVWLLILQACTCGGKENDKKRRIRHKSPEKVPPKDLNKNAVRSQKYFLFYFFFFFNEL